MPQSPPVVCFTENHARRIFTRVMAPPVCFGSDCPDVLCLSASAHQPELSTDGSTFVSEQQKL